MHDSAYARARARAMLVYSFFNRLQERALNDKTSLARAYLFFRALHLLTEGTRVRVEKKTSGGARGERETVLR